MEIFSIQELEKVIRHVEIEGQGEFFKKKQGNNLKIIRRNSLVVSLITLLIIS
ncbi:hypothetical protein AAHH67_14540 [Niallia circulans]